MSVADEFAADLARRVSVETPLTYRQARQWVDFGVAMDLPVDQIERMAFDCASNGISPADYISKLLAGQPVAPIEPYGITP